MSELKSTGKPFDISKGEVWEAYLKVKENQGAAGVDGCTIEEFEKDLKGNLYKIWNRMSSGSYFPLPVKGVGIPKSHGDGVRLLGVPTVSDRIAQTVVAKHLEKRVEPLFHADSYGYRPGRSALDAVSACRQRCWKKKWAIDLDIAKFFDSVRWDLVIKTVESHTDAAWVILYVKRWLAAPVLMPNGTLQQRDRGTPQGSAVSPILANLFLHYAFDMWLTRTFPGVQFERYADDAVIHCSSERQVREVLAQLEGRMAEVGLQLHPDKTRIVYCGRERRRDDTATSFAFLGFTFRNRPAQDRHGKVFTSFLPAVSKGALKKMSAEVRSWRIHMHVTYSFGEFAKWLNPIIRGWMQYYGAFYQTELYPLLQRINFYLLRWVRKKHKRLKTYKKASRRWDQVVKSYPSFFAHWKWVNVT
ncbi:group II intron reverse transcriptase/maturase [Streptomyces sp. NPDC005195]|uniref:group II intron reverse transcriptase/maturase n=1 Tax=Streptomyces sp. NPDC005195 TaxID=3154561 RepID=UPI0033BD92B4